MMTMMMTTMMMSMKKVYTWVLWVKAWGSGQSGTRPTTVPYSHSRAKPVRSKTQTQNQKTSKVTNQNLKPKRSKTKTQNQITSKVKNQNLKPEYQ